MSFLKQEIAKIIAEILEVEASEIDPNAQFVKDLGMDSMMALEILASIEKKYKVAIPEEMLPKFSTLEETHKIVSGIINKKK